jgi:hypothetical protein
VTLHTIFQDALPSTSRPSHGPAMFAVRPTPSGRAGRPRSAVLSRRALTGLWPASGPTPAASGPDRQARPSRRHAVARRAARPPCRTAHVEPAPRAASAPARSGAGRWAHPGRAVARRAPRVAAPRTGRHGGGPGAEAGGDPAGVGAGRAHPARGAPAAAVPPSLGAAGPSAADAEECAPQGARPA